MGLTLLEAPTGEPVALADAKAHCKVDADITADDSLITALIVAARQQAERITGRALITQRWRLSLDRFPDDSLELPRPPLASVQSITYLDQDGVRQALAEAEYQVITDELVGRVLPAYGKAWPACRDVPGSVLVEFTAGYGNAATVPEDIKLWMKMFISATDMQRAAISADALHELPFWARMILWYRLDVIA